MTATKPRVTKARGGGWQATWRTYNNRPAYVWRRTWADAYAEALHAARSTR